MNIRCVGAYRTPACGADARKSAIDQHRFAVWVILAFTRWDDKSFIYRHAALASRVFEIERPAVDTIFIATGMRPEGLKGQLEAEVENHQIFNCRVDFVVIDGSDEESREVFERDRTMLGELTAKYGTHFLHLDAKNHWYGDIAAYAEKLTQRLNKELAAGSIDATAREIFTLRKVIGDNNTIETKAMVGFLLKNVFRHISGVRNYTVLLGKGLKVIMNIDDDAPPETYVLFSHERNAMMNERLAARQRRMQEMFEEVSARLNTEVKDEVGHRGAR